MATTLTIGSALETAAPPNVHLHVEPGSTVQVTNVSGGTLKHYVGGFGSTYFTTTQGNNNSHVGGGVSAAGQVVLVPTGRTTITLTGAGY